MCALLWKKVTIYINLSMIKCGATPRMNIHCNHFSFVFFLIIIFIIEAFLLCGVYIYIVCVCVCLLVGGVGHGCKLISW